MRSRQTMLGGVRTMSGSNGTSPGQNMPTCDDLFDANKVDIHGELTPRGVS